MQQIDDIDECLKSDASFCRTRARNNGGHIGGGHIGGGNVSGSGNVSGGGNVSGKYNEVYKQFINYYGNMTFTKIKSINDHSIYMARIKSMLGGFNYIIILIPEDGLVSGYTKMFSELKWVCLQTSYARKDHNLTPQAIQNSEGLKNIIQLRNKIDDYYIYTVDSLPIKVTLKNDKNASQAFASKLTILLALQTYKCMIELT